MIRRSSFLQRYADAQLEVRRRVRDYLEKQGVAEVHELRTSIRRFDRISSLLPASVRKEKKQRRYRVGLRELAHLNSRIRDIDIIRATLAPAFKEAEAPGLMARLLQERASLLDPALRLASSIPERPPVLEKEYIAGRKLRTRFRKVTRELLEEMEADLSVVLKEPGELRALHSLRISTKDLRYAVDLLSEEAGDIPERLKEWQDLLGKVRDIDAVSAFLRDLDLHDAIDEFIEKKSRERRRLYLRFVASSKRSTLPRRIRALLSG